MPPKRKRTSHGDLLKAVQIGDEDTVRQILEENAALQWAKNSHLWQPGLINSERSTDDGKTLLMHAARRGYMGIATLLMENTSSDWNLCHERDNRCRTALMEAAREGNTDMVRLLIQKGSDVNARAVSGTTALMEAILYYGHWRESNESTVRLLVDEKADINAKSFRGWTALMCAAFHGRESIARLLVEDQKADINIRDDSGWTALMYATVSGKEAIARLLIENGCDFHALGSATVRDSHTPPAWSTYERSPDALCGRDKWSAFECAARSGHVPTIRLLIEKEAHERYFTRERNGKTLRAAAVSGCEEAFYEILTALEYRDQDIVETTKVLIKNVRKNTSARLHAQSIQRLIDEDKAQLSDGVYLKLCDMNKRVFDKNI
jgi:ankyrin repeat protein